MKNKKAHRQLRAFFFTLTICIIIFAFFTGIATVFTRTESLISAEPRAVFKVSKNENSHNITVLGEDFSIAENKTEPSPLTYVLIPPELRLVCGAFGAFGNYVSPVPEAVEAPAS